METEKRKDPLTGEVFIPKKKTQRFASSENRIKFNNQLATDLRERRAVIDKKINLNHRILLQELDDKDEVILHEMYLEGRGFSFLVFNHIVEHEGVNRNCIYEFIIIILKNNHIKIIRNERF